MATFHIHHLDHDPGNNAEPNLQVLCCRCHQTLPKSLYPMNRRIVGTKFTSEYKEELLEKARGYCQRCFCQIERPSSPVSRTRCLRCGEKVDTSAYPTGERGFHRFENGSLLCHVCLGDYVAEMVRRGERGEYPPDPATWRGESGGIKIPEHSRMITPESTPGVMKLFPRGISCKPAKTFPRSTRARARRLAP